MKRPDLPIVLAVSRSLRDYQYQIDFMYHQENKQVTKVRQGEFVVNNVRYIFISADNPRQMQGFHGVKVEFWGSLHGVSKETQDLIQHYKISVERP